MSHVPAGPGRNQTSRAARRFNGCRRDQDRIGDELWRVDCRHRRLGEHEHVRFEYGA